MMTVKLDIHRLVRAVSANQKYVLPVTGIALCLLLNRALPAQTPRGQAAPQDTTPTLRLERGFLEFDTPELRLKLVKASQTVAALEPQNAAPGGFDFTPGDRLAQRARNNNHHLGDLTLRLRFAGATEWTSYSTAASRKPVKALPGSPGTLAAADLAATLPPDIPLRVIRSWKVVDGQLVLSFRLTNISKRRLEIGALGIPVVFNNIMTGRSLAESNATCSFFDPYIGMDAGYVQVTRLSGAGPALLVVPEGRTPFEGWAPLDDATRRTQTFEGVFEWLVHTRAFAENEWRDVEPWNTPTSTALSAGESATYGLRFLLAPEIRDIESTLRAARRPVAVGIPGYVAPMNQTLQLFLSYHLPAKSVAVQPEGALTVVPHGAVHGWHRFTLQGRRWGRARVTITYADDTRQVVSYYVTKAPAQAVADLGNFLFTKQWFDNRADPFGRSPSVMSYDRAHDRIVDQDARVWIAGLSDEGGAGSWLTAAMKLSGQPEAQQVRQYEQFVDSVLWGRIQYKEGPRTYGVRKSVFYYDSTGSVPFAYDAKLNWHTWASWSKEQADATDRGYDYPHVVAAYWSLYHLARYYDGLVTNHPWQWYLSQAYRTIMFLTAPESGVGYVELGLMDGDAFMLVLKDMQREGWTLQADSLEQRMRARADHWSKQPYPFGSEMSWDSTGQEEVFLWCSYFGFSEKALEALNSIIGYMPTLPHWGYNGSARRYWDFIYAGAPGGRYERQLHHYGSGINAIPVLAYYRAHPDDYYLLRVGYGGTMGALTNIDEAGFASVAFHSFPNLLHWDAYSGDYGPNFFGHALNTGTYVIRHEEFGWQAFGGNVNVSGDWVHVRVDDTFQQRIYIAPLGLFLTLEAGTFQAVQINERTGAVRLILDPAAPFAPNAWLRIEQPARRPRIGVYHPHALRAERGAFRIPLGPASTVIELTDH